MPKSAKSPVPPIHPREKMTIKAREAILRYVVVKCGDNRLLERVIHYALEAERMPRERLYKYLIERGFVWRPRLDTWLKN